MRAPMLVLAVALAAAATTAEAGPALVASTPYTLPPSDQLSGRDRYLLSDPAAYDAVAGDRTVELRRIRYRSGGLTVAGFAAVPRAPGKARLPVVIWCRGGYGPRDVVGDGNVETLHDLARVAAAGFVVLMPNYRGNDGGEGVDERGGAEVEDVKALVAVARELPAADPSRLFAYGVSRGSLDALIAMREGLPVRAVVVTGVVADEVARPLPPGLPAPAGVDWTSAAARERRSPARWAKELTAPVLILQGGDDRATPPEGAMALAGALERAGAVYELWIAAGGDHGLTRQHREARLARTIDWFTHVRTQSAALVIERALDEGGAALARTRFAAIRKDRTGRYTLDERALNTTGYVLLARGRLDDAVTVLELNAQAFPRSANVWDSLGEAYLAAGKPARALAMYERALAIDPDLPSAKDAVARLRAKK